MTRYYSTPYYNAYTCSNLRVRVPRWLVQSPGFKGLKIDSNDSASMQSLIRSWKDQATNDGSVETGDVSSTPKTFSQEDAPPP